jgi:hypothetical protein
MGCTKPSYGIEAFMGDDEHFSHRAGGRIVGTAWLDTFSQGNNAQSVASLVRTLGAGDYRIFWKAHLIYNQPACSNSPDPDHSSLLSTVSGGGIQYLQEERTEPYCCAHRVGLEYSEGIEQFFTTTQDGNVRMSLNADNGRIGATNSSRTNVKEVYIYYLELETL